MAAATVPVAAVVAIAGDRPAGLPGAFHFVAVAAAGLLVLGLGVLVARLGRTQRDARAVLVGAAFSVVGALLAVHGLATPGEMMDANGLVLLAGAANLPAGGLLLAASAHRRLRRTARVDALWRAQAALVAAIAAIGVVALLAPSAVPDLPQPGTAAAWIATALAWAALGLLVWRAASTWALTCRRDDLLVAVGLGWLAVAVWAVVHFPASSAAFWVGHVLETGGIAMIAVPTLLDLRRGAAASRALVGDLTDTDLVADQELALGARVRALLQRLTEVDPGTAGHTRRVAETAVAVGEEVGLAAADLDRLALGGLLHDMGKLRTPREILHKPGRLGEEEVEAIRRHPEDGVALLRELGGFDDEVLELVEGHHERLDGSGYPHGLRALDLPLTVRILAAADVYDALTSDRVYRPAWSTDRAIAGMHAERGAFDPAVLAALERVVERRAGAPEQQGVRLPERRDGGERRAPASPPAGDERAEDERRAGERRAPGLAEATAALRAPRMPSGVLRDAGALPVPVAAVHDEPFRPALPPRRRPRAPAEPAPAPVPARRVKRPPLVPRG